MILSYEEFETYKPKDEGLGIRLKKVHKKEEPPKVSDEMLEVLIGSYLYTYISTNALSIHQVHLLSALLELKDSRGRASLVPASS